MNYVVFPPTIFFLRLEAVEAAAVDVADAVGAVVAAAMVLEVAAPVAVVAVVTDFVAVAVVATLGKGCLQQRLFGLSAFVPAGPYGFQPPC